MGEYSAICLLLFFVINSTVSAPQDNNIKDIAALPQLVQDFIRNNNIETIKVIEVDNMDVLSQPGAVHKYSLPIRPPRYYSNYNRPMTPERPQFIPSHHGHGPPFNNPYNHPSYYGPPNHHHGSNNHYRPPTHYGRPPHGNNPLYGYPPHHGHRPNYSHQQHGEHPTHGNGINYGHYGHPSYPQTSPEPITLKPDIKPTIDPEYNKPNNPTNNNNQNSYVNKPTNHGNEHSANNKPNIDQTLIDIFGTPESSTEYPLIDERFKPDQTSATNILENNSSPQQTVAPFQAVPITPEI